ncbi:MAG: hypothetical protein LBP41_00125 [Holosporaceae bacterium]|jgi:flagellar biosynthesis chaperone FliJ|nr:hypothetical protein [Holosporaceae bacterium]
MLKTISKILVFVVCFTVFSGNNRACEVNNPKPFYVRFFESSFDGFVADTIAKVEKFQKTKNVSSDEIEQTKQELKEFFSKSGIREKYDQLKQAHLERRNAMNDLFRLEAEDPVLLSELREKMAGRYVNKLKTSFRKSSMPTFAECVSNAHATIDNNPSISQNERKQAHREVDEFFKRSVAKKSYEKLRQNHQKMTHVPKKTSGLQKPNITADKINISIEYSNINAKQILADHETLLTLSSIREEVEAFEKEHQFFAKWNKYALTDLCYASMSGFIANAAILGLSDINVVIASILWILPQSMAAIIENGTEELVEYSASHGNTEAEAVEFGATAIWFMETMIQQDPLQQQKH